MARLNEPPAAPAAPAVTALAAGVESVDALKRRFIRQNRELAKNNSSQSLRIRSLEIDVSRLLQTNLELREELLRARNAEYEAKRESTRDGVRGFKEEMMTKLRELRGIVEGIEEEQHKEDDRTAEREDRRASVLSQMDFRERQPLADLMRECQMPTIDEDKIHARRSLEPAETKVIRLSDGSSNGSPDLGPPPIARFEQDPIKFDARNATELVEAEAQAEVETESEPEKKTQDDDLPASMSVNLETRRRRKDSQPKLELRRHSILPPPSPSSSEADITAPTLRVGAKRKLADRDLDKPAKGPSKTDFTFNRKTSMEPTKTTEMPVEPEDQPEPVTEIQAPILAQPPSARRVLGDKSVNMSPRKTAVTSDKEKDDPKKPAQPKFGPAAAKERISRRPRLSAVPVPVPSSPAQEPPVATIEPPTSESLPLLHELPPTTPAAASIFSPTPEASATTTTSRQGTPPPSSNDAARPSRRARSAVNYAEPSLGAKMRRQEKGMMDAVTGLKHHRTAMSAASAERKAKREIIVKEEPVDEDAWKILAAVPDRAASPLEEKSGLNGNVFPAPELATIVQRDHSASTHQADADVNAEADLDSAAEKLKELDLYDFKDSSSPPTESQEATAAASTGTSKSRPSTSRAPPKSASRRHSSIPKDTTAPSRSAASRPSTASSGSTGAASASSRRRSMMI